MIFAVPQVPKPPYLHPITDPTFGTTVTRIVGDEGTGIIFSAGGVGMWGSDARQHYMDDQPWNSDGTLLLLENRGSPNEVILDGNTYEPKYAKCPNYNNNMDRWLQGCNRPHERMNVNGTLLEWFDVVNCTQTRKWTLPIPATADYEMGPSNDGRFVALGDNTRAFVVDMDPQPPFASYASGNERIGPAFDISACGDSDCTMSYISISPSGRYVIVKYSHDRVRVLDVDPHTLALSPRPMPQTAPECSGHNQAQGFVFDLGHQDMGFNPFDNNEEVMFDSKTAVSQA
jgi:hypothetical protein